MATIRVYGSYEAQHRRPRPRCFTCCDVAVFVLLAVATVLLLVLVAMLQCVALQGYKTPRYSATVDSASGLDDLGRPALGPLFNLTLRVASRGGRGCILAGTAVEVSYAGVPLAAGTAQRLCTGPWKMSEQAVVAWGTGVRVSASVLDRLAADVRRGVEAFDVTLRMPSTHGNGHEGKLMPCRGSRPGDATALRSPCTAADVGTVCRGPRTRAMAAS